MKIGILTFWWSQDNYGQILQCYALQKFLRDMGHDAYLIRYNLANELSNKYTNVMSIKRILKMFYPVSLYKQFMHKLKIYKLNKQNNENPRYFNDFKNKYIAWSPVIYNSYEELLKNPPVADMYIVGSDQVWNPNGLGGEKKKSFEKILNVYFLNFGNAKRVSYAASWGVSELSQNCINLINPLLQKFYYVSVREKSGVDLCNKCGYKNAEWVCDPTMLLEPEVYREIYRSEPIRKIDSKYLLLYMLSNENEFDIESVYKFASEKKLDVVYVSGNNTLNKRDSYYATIPEWLYLIDNATYIITNSFHCGVFSTVFKKQFGIVPLSGKYQGMNSRMESLFEIFNITSRYIQNNNFEILDKKYDGKMSKEVIGNFVNKLNA